MSWSTDIPMVGGGEGLEPPTEKKRKQERIVPQEKFPEIMEEVPPLTTGHRVASGGHGEKVAHAARRVTMPYTEQEVKECLENVLHLPVADVISEEGGYRIQYSQPMPFFQLHLDQQYKIYQHRRYGDQSFIRDVDVQTLLSRKSPASSRMAATASTTIEGKTQIEAKLQQLGIPGNAIKEVGGWRIEFGTNPPNFSAVSMCNIFEHIGMPGCGFIKDSDVNGLVSLVPQQSEVVQWAAREGQTRAAIEKKLHELGYEDAKAIRSPDGWRIQFGMKKPEYSSLSKLGVIQHRHPYPQFGFIKQGKDLNAFLQSVLGSVTQQAPAASDMTPQNPPPDVSLEPLASTTSAPKPVSASKSAAKTKLSEQLKKESTFIKDELEQAFRQMGLPAKKISLEHGGYRIIGETSPSTLPQGSIIRYFLEHGILEAHRDPPSLFVKFDNVPMLELGTVTACGCMCNVLQMNGIPFSGPPQIDLENRCFTFSGCNEGLVPPPFNQYLYHPTNEPTKLRVKIKDVPAMLSANSGWIVSAKGVLTGTSKQVAQFVNNFGRLTKGVQDIFMAQSSAREEAVKKEVVELEEKAAAAKKATNPPTEQEILEAKKLLERAEEEKKKAEKSVKLIGKKFRPPTK